MREARFLRRPTRSERSVQVLVHANGQQVILGDKAETPDGGQVTIRGWVEPTRNQPSGRVFYTFDDEATMGGQTRETLPAVLKMRFQ